MKVLVTGGRNYQDRSVVFAELTRLHRFGEYVTLVIHGACCDPNNKTQLRGADRWAQEWAQEHEVPYVGHPANWERLGRGAGPRRNEAMLRLWLPDIVIAFPGGAGTNDMVTRASATNAEVLVIDVDAISEDAQ